MADSAQGRYAQKLLGDLMEDYSNALRPVEDTDKALNVTLQITLSQIKDMVRVTVPLGRLQRGDVNLVSRQLHVLPSRHGVVILSPTPDLTFHPPELMPTIYISPINTQGSNHISAMFYSFHHYLSWESGRVPVSNLNG